jgi:hypothetical protein
MRKADIAAEVEWAAEYLTCAPGFAKADIEMRDRTEPILHEIEKAPLPRPQAIKWFDAHADCYLALVTDRDSWKAYLSLLYNLWYPQARQFLFGVGAWQPITPDGIELAEKLDRRCQHWHRKASVTFANYVGSKRPAGKKPVRRNANYETIDLALREISEARPKDHQEVFRFLQDRKVPIPNRKPFKPAGGWLRGFQQNRPAAAAWLSQAWGRLGLPTFARGPKK